MPIICLMVRENHKMVREMSGKSQGILWELMAGHPDQVYQILFGYIGSIMSSYLTHCGIFHKSLLFQCFAQGECND